MRDREDWGGKSRRDVCFRPPLLHRAILTYLRLSLLQELKNALFVRVELPDLYLLPLHLLLELDDAHVQRPGLFLLLRGHFPQARALRVRRLPFRAYRAVLVSELGVPLLDDQTGLLRVNPLGLQLSPKLAVLMLKRADALLRGDALGSHGSVLSLVV